MAFCFSNSPGEKIGPVTREELVRLAEEGSITETTRVLTCWRNRSARTLSFLKPAFEKRAEQAAERKLTWQAAPPKETGNMPAALPCGYGGDIYFSPFWRRSRRLRRTLKIVFWGLLILLVLAAALFAGSFTFLAGKTTLLGVFGNVFFGLAAFFVIFPLFFSLILCRVGIASTYAHEAQVRAAEDLRKLRMLNESKRKGE